MAKVKVGFLLPSMLATTAAPDDGSLFPFSVIISGLYCRIHCFITFPLFYDGCMAFSEGSKRNASAKRPKSIGSGMPGVFEWSAIVSQLLALALALA